MLFRQRADGRCQLTTTQISPRGRLWSCMLEKFELCKLPLQEHNKAITLGRKRSADGGQRTLNSGMHKP